MDALDESRGRLRWGPFETSGRIAAKGCSSCGALVVAVVDVLGDVLGDERRALAESDGVIESRRTAWRDHVLERPHARTTA